MSSMIHNALKKDANHNGIPDIADKAIAHFAPGHNGSHVNAAGGAPIASGGHVPVSSSNPGHLIEQAKDMLTGHHGGGGAAGISNLLSQATGHTGAQQHH